MNTNTVELEMRILDSTLLVDKLATLVLLETTKAVTTTLQQEGRGIMFYFYCFKNFAGAMPRGWIPKTPK
jgi:hypothetical protein